MSKDELLKVVKNQFLLKKKLEIKINELTTSNVNFSQIEEVTNFHLLSCKIEHKTIYYYYYF